MIANERDENEVVSIQMETPPKGQKKRNERMRESFAYYWRISHSFQSVFLFWEGGGGGRKGKNSRERRQKNKTCSSRKKSHLTDRKRWYERLHSTCMFINTERKDSSQHHKSGEGETIEHDFGKNSIKVQRFPNKFHKHICSTYVISNRNIVTGRCARNGTLRNWKFHRSKLRALEVINPSPQRKWERSKRITHLKKRRKMKRTGKNTYRLDCSQFLVGDGEDYTVFRGARSNCALS